MLFQLTLLSLKLKWIWYEMGYLAVCLLQFLSVLELYLKTNLLQNLSAKLYTALRMLRTTLVKEAGDSVFAYHIFG